MNAITLPELVGVRSAVVPGFPRVRASEEGHLWQWDGEQWERIGTAPGKTITLRDASGARRVLRKPRLICAAWCGERPAGWAVGFRDGSNKNLRPSNLLWCRTKPGYPRKLEPSIQDLVRKRAAAGEKQTALAREFKVNVATIVNICKSYVPRGPTVAKNRWLNADERKEILRLK